MICFYWEKNEVKLKWFIMKGLLIGFDGFILLYGRDLLLVWNKNYVCVFFIVKLNIWIKFGFFVKFYFG